MRSVKTFARMTHRLNKFINRSTAIISDSTSLDARRAALRDKPSHSRHRQCVVTIIIRRVSAIIVLVLNAN